MPPKKNKSSTINENAEVTEQVEKPLNTANAVIKHYGISVAELKEILEEIYQASLEEEAS